MKSVNNLYVFGKKKSTIFGTEIINLIRLNLKFSF